MSQTAKQIIDIYEREDAALVHENWSASTRLLAAKKCIRTLTELLGASAQDATTTCPSCARIIPARGVSRLICGGCGWIDPLFSAGEAAESGRTGATPVNPVGGAPEAPAPGPHPSPAPHRSRADLSANGGTREEWIALVNAEARENARRSSRRHAHELAAILNVADDKDTLLLREMLRAFANPD